jgi:hypothetical protein
MLRRQMTRPGRAGPEPAGAGGAREGRRASTAARMAGRWISTCGQTLVKRRSNAGQTPVKRRSNAGQTPEKRRSFWPDARGAQTQQGPAKGVHCDLHLLYTCFAQSLRRLAPDSHNKGPRPTELPEEETPGIHLIYA